MPELYPAYFVLLGLIVYAIAWLYARWYDKKVWEPNPKVTTPAHMYMDGIEFFPASKFVLFGFQYKGIAALGPILGPFIALSFGWLPALIWILLGNLFIGWIHDYGALFTSVRREGKTMGPLTYELISPRARSCLMGYLLFYLMIIGATFMYLSALFFWKLPSSVTPTIFTIIAGIVFGVLLYRFKVNIWASTIIGIIIMVVGLWLGITFPIIYPGAEPHLFWMIIFGIIVFIGAVTPIIWYTQPTNYMAFYPCTFGVIIIIIGALLSPIWGITIQQPAFVTAFTYDWAKAKGPGPIWPILMVSIACGAISGWHSLLGTSGSARQLDVETDALPVGAGAMLMEGLLALSALSAYIVIPGVVKPPHWLRFAADGAPMLTANLFGGAPAIPALQAFFGAFLELYAITVTFLLWRFWRLALAEVAAPSPRLRATIGNVYIGTFIGILLGIIFAYTGAWLNLWLLFGGSNQLMAGLALLLVSIHLAHVKKPTVYNLAPSLFMIITCQVALAWQMIDFFTAVAVGITKVGMPLAGYPAVATGFDLTFGIIAIILFILGLIVAYDGFKALAKVRKASASST
ncbi:MAG: Carbon starvation protein CstA [Candidatus Bathyarchaeota archaeon BA1]|nr:MAG: Carbon starvation protein CstA [Candidatus Bathyarchaeota archaeon BA1]